MKSLLFVSILLVSFSTLAWPGKIPRPSDYNRPVPVKECFKHNKMLNDLIIELNKLDDLQDCLYINLHSSRKRQSAQILCTLSSDNSYLINDVQVSCDSPNYQAKLIFDYQLLPLDEYADSKLE